MSALDYLLLALIALAALLALRFVRKAGKTADAAAIVHTAAAPAIEKNNSR